MANVRFIVIKEDGTLVADLDVKDQQFFPLSITYSLGSIQVLDTRGMDYTKEFLIPASGYNQVQLGAVSDTRKSTLQAYTGIIQVDGVEYIRGNMRITEASGEDYPMWLNVKLFGSNGVWLDAVSNTKLADIDWGSIVYEVSNIEAQWDNYNLFTEHVAFPIISYGEFTGAAPDDQAFVKLEDILPAIRITHAIEQMFSLNGWTLVSEFFDGLNPILDPRPLTMPLTSDTFRKPEQDVTPFEFFAKTDPTVSYTNLTICGTNADNADLSLAQRVDFQVEVTPSAFYDNTLGVSEFTGFTGVAKFTVAYSFTWNQTGIKQYNVVVFVVVEDVTTAQTGYVIDSNGIGLLSSNPSVGQGETPEIQLVSTDKVYVMLALLHDTDTGATTVDIDWEEDSIFQNQPLQDISRGETIVFSDVMPDVYCVDLLKGLKLPFNLMFAANLPERKIYIEPRDSFYYPFSESIDWTGKLDARSINVLFPDNLKRTQIFGYDNDSKDGDVENRNLVADQSSVDYRLGDGVYVLPNRFPVGEDRVESEFFSPTNFLNDDLNHFSTGKLSTNPINDGRFPTISRLWTDFGTFDEPPGFSDDFNFRLLYWQFVENGGIMFWDDGTGTDYTTLKPFPTAHFGSDPHALSLGFPQLEFKNGEDLDGNVVNGLLQNFYSNHLRTLQKGTMLQAKFNLTAKDISQVDLRRLIYLEFPGELNGYWAIEEISDFQPARGNTTTVTMVKMEPLRNLTLNG